jgi:cystathionine beta-lyase family protein involved in aluminum resistance
MLLIMNQSFFNINENLTKASDEATELCRSVFLEIEKIAEYNSLKVLSAFIENGVSETHFSGSTGYGYGDKGREVLDCVFAQSLGAEDALVRHNFVSGTHALTTALFGVLRPSDTLLACTGKPYDTLEEVIGIRGNGMGSLKDFGVQYKQIDLLPDGNIDLVGIFKVLKDKNIKAVYIQRSRGYSLRPSLTIAQIEQFCNEVKVASPHTCIMVDNCYGEFVETKEPLQVGADLIIGSLIKNPGGGMADTGGYIAGKKQYVELAAYRLTSPGMGKEVGATLNQSKGMFKGLFFAPHITAQALKTAVFAAALFELLGFEVTPVYNEPRTDIIQAIKLGSSEALVAFCQGMQKGSPVDSFVVPEAWDMPGYDSKVIMAAGAFTMGASIELSADAPLKPPFAAWMQGGLTYETGKMGVLLAAQSMIDRGIIKFLK